MEMRLAGAEHAEAIRAIYNPEVTDTTVTFDMVPRTHDDQLPSDQGRAGDPPSVHLTLIILHDVLRPD